MRSRAESAIKVGAVPRRDPVRPHDGPDRPLAAAGDDLLLRRRADPGLPVRHQVDAAAARRPAVLRRHPDHLGHALPDRHRPAGRDPARAAVRDLPLGVRAPAGAQGDQADPRDARRRPHHRLRLLRPHLLHAERHPRAAASTSTSSTRCRPGSSSACSSCRRSPRWPRTRCRRCPPRCARARSGSAPPSSRSPCGSSSRPRSRASWPRSILGASRAVGETVIILIAGGQTANLGVDPRESYQSMAAFIAATARGDIPTGSIEYETIFVVGFTLFVMTLAAQRGLDPARPQVPAGVRMTGAQIAARAARRSGPCCPRPAAATASTAGSSGCSCTSRSASPSSGSARSSTTSSASGASKLSWDFLTSQPSRIIPANSGIMSALVRHALPDGDRRRHRGPARRRHRDLPRGVRRSRPLVQPPRRGQHPEPRRGALGRLRHPRARVHRPRPAEPGQRGAGGRHHARPARAARS